MALIGGQRIGQLGIDLTTDDVERLLEFYQNIFDAEPTYVYKFSSGKIAAIGLRIVNTHFRIIWSSDKPAKRCGARFTVYLPNVEAVVERALTYGAELVPFLGTSEAQLTVDMATGDRASRFRDPAGHLWEARTWLEAVSAEEALKRVQAKRLGSQNGLSVA